MVFVLFSQWVIKSVSDKKGYWLEAWITDNQTNSLIPVLHHINQVYILSLNEYLFVPRKCYSEM